MNAFGHNETAVRLAALAGDAQIALDRVATGEADAMGGWLAYGAALNEGRSMFPGDREFGEWLSQWQVAIAVEPHERAAAMWAAANADQLAEAQAASNARTLRGLHAKWKEIEAERQRAAEQAQRKAEAEARAKVDPVEPAAPFSPLEADGGSPAEVGEAPQPGEQDAASGALIPDADRPGEGVVAPPPADPDAAQRKELAKLTREGLEDEVIGLRAENADLRARVKKQTGQIADLKAHIKDLEADDKNEVIRRQAKEIEHLRSQMFRAHEDARRHIAARRWAEDRVKELENAGVAY